MKTCILTILIFLMPHSVSALEIGEYLPSDVADSTQYALISAAQLDPSYQVKVGEFEYNVATYPDSKLIRYIEIKDKGFVSEEGAHTGMTLSEISKLTTENLIEERGWAYYVPLPSGWFAAFCVGQGCTSGAVVNSSVVSWLFKR